LKIFHLFISFIKLKLLHSLFFDQIFVKKKYIYKLYDDDHHRPLFSHQTCFFFLIKNENILHIFLSGYIISCNYYYY
jgi:hypothetical protein